VLNADLLVDCVEDYRRLGVRFVRFGEISRWMAARGVDAHVRHGYVFQKIESAELASESPRIAKWRTGPHASSRVAYSVVSDTSVPTGWTRLR
jgi:hypothetical protein